METCVNRIKKVSNGEDSGNNNQRHLGNTGQKNEGKEHAMEVVLSCTVVSGSLGDDTSRCPG